MPEIEYPEPRLEDGVIALRLVREDGVAAVTAACQDPLITRYTLVPSPYGEDDAREWFRVAERSRAESKGRRWDEVMFSLLPGDLEGT